MGKLKWMLAGLFVATVTLLALGVLDLCRVGDDGRIAFAPRLETRALSHYARAALDAVWSPAPAAAEAR
ncbi:MAG: hypothetical protein HMLKMBBP_03131 [Planctomycetes bacterium]|nr:hypothetical protein [Planctomycetota bacterium]